MEYIDPVNRTKQILFFVTVIPCANWLTYPENIETADGKWFNHFFASIIHIQFIGGTIDSAFHIVGHWRWYAETGNSLKCDQVVSSERRKCAQAAYV